MQKNRIDKTKLIAIVKTNREKHHAEWTQAQRKYQELLARKLDELAALVKTAIFKDESFALHKDIMRPIGEIIEPVNKTEDYDMVLTMLELSVDDVIELEDHEFKSYVMDKWDWSEKAHLSNSRYR
jgi:hypothetical protein